jgi:hypothetical protein
VWCRGEEAGKKLLGRRVLIVVRPRAHPPAPRTHVRRRTRSTTRARRSSAPLARSLLLHADPRAAQVRGRGAAEGRRARARVAARGHARRAADAVRRVRRAQQAQGEAGQDPRGRPVRPRVALCPATAAAEHVRRRYFVGQEIDDVWCVPARAAPGVLALRLMLCAGWTTRGRRCEQLRREPGMISDKALMGVRQGHRGARPAGGAAEGEGRGASMSVRACVRPAVYPMFFCRQRERTTADGTASGDWRTAGIGRPPLRVYRTRVLRDGGRRVGAAALDGRRSCARASPLSALACLSSALPAALSSGARCSPSSPSSSVYLSSACCICLAPSRTKPVTSLSAEPARPRFSAPSPRVPRCSRHHRRRPTHRHGGHRGD